MIAVLFLVLIIKAAETEMNTGSCKDMLQGYLTGQLASALGSYQVEALRREFRGFTEHVEKSMNLFKEKVATDIQKMQGIKSITIIISKTMINECKHI